MFEMPFPLIIDKIDKLKPENFPYGWKKPSVRQREKAKLNDTDTRKGIDMGKLRHKDTRKNIDVVTLKQTDTHRRLNHNDTRKTLDVGKLKCIETRKILGTHELPTVNVRENYEDDYESFVDLSTRKRWTDKRRSTIVNPGGDGWYGSRMPYKFELKFQPRRPHSSIVYRKKVRRGLTKVRTILALRRTPAKYNQNGSRNLPRLKSQSRRLTMKTPGELPPITQLRSYVVKHQDSFNRHQILPSIEKQTKGHQADHLPGIVHLVSKRNLKRQTSNCNIPDENLIQYSRHGHSGDREPLNYYRVRRPSLENVALLATFSASLIGSHRRRQARRRSTANWRRLSNNSKQPELWTRLQSRKLRSILNNQYMIDKWYKVTSGIKVCYFLFQLSH